MKATLISQSLAILGATGLTALLVGCSGLSNGFKVQQNKSGESADAWAAGAFPAGPATPGLGTTYYVSPHGNDNSDGLSPATAWKSVAKAGRQIYGPGTSLLFEGGQTFTGCLNFDLNNLTSTEAQPFTIGAYGGGKFTLLSNCAGQNNASSGPRIPLIRIDGVSGFILKDAVLSGNGTNTQYGVLIINSSSQVMSGITIQGCDISDFTNTSQGDASAEIDIQGYPGITPTAIQNVKILNNKLHGAHGAASLDDRAIDGWGNGPNIRNVLVQGNEVYDIGGHSNVFAAGISMDGMNNSVAQNNSVHDIGANGTICGGPGGILTADSTELTIQYNEVYNVVPASYSSGCDWVGIDLDIGTSNSIVQYNYVHDTRGAGLMIYAGNGADSTNDVFRYNLSVNSANNQSGDSNVRISGGSNAIVNLQIFNNTFYNDDAHAISFEVADWGLASTSGTVANNIFYSVRSSKFMDIPFTTADISALKFVNNDYYSGAGGFSFKWGNTVYASLVDLAGATGLETLNGRVVGLNVDPAFVNPGPVGATHGFQPAGLAGFGLQSGSPMRGAGLNLESVAAISVGAADLFGNRIPGNVGTGFNLGADGK